MPDEAVLSGPPGTNSSSDTVTNFLQGSRAACQVPGCTKALPRNTLYHKRYRICSTHAALPSVELDGAEMRFCQQCGRFQTLDEFDGPKKTCRRKLEQHNAQRKRARDKLKHPSSPPKPASLISPVTRLRAHRSPHRDAKSDQKDFELPGSSGSSHADSVGPRSRDQRPVPNAATPRRQIPRQPVPLAQAPAILPDIPDGLLIPNFGPRESLDLDLLPIPGSSRGPSLSKEELAALPPIIQLPEEPVAPSRPTMQGIETHFANVNLASTSNSSGPDHVAHQQGAAAALPAAPDGAAPPQQIYSPELLAASYSLFNAHPSALPPSVRQILEETVAAQRHHQSPGSHGRSGNS